MMTTRKSYGEDDLYTSGELSKSEVVGDSES